MCTELVARAARAKGESRSLSARAKKSHFCLPLRKTLESQFRWTQVIPTILNRLSMPLFIQPAKFKPNACSSEKNSSAADPVAVAEAPLVPRLVAVMVEAVAEAPARAPHVSLKSAGNSTRPRFLKREPPKRQNDCLNVRHLYSRFYEIPSGQEENARRRFQRVVMSARRRRWCCFLFSSVFLSGRTIARKCGWIKIPNPWGPFLFLINPKSNTTHRFAMLSQRLRLMMPGEGLKGLQKKQSLHHFGRPSSTLITLRKDRDLLVLGLEVL